MTTSDTGKKFILCITDAFTKYVELVALPNKEAATVAEAIFDKWICWFGTPLDLVTWGLIKLRNFVPNCPKSVKAEQPEQ